MQEETLTQLMTRLENHLGGGSDRWYAAIAALESILLSTVVSLPKEQIGGLVLSLPSSLIRSQTLLDRLKIGILSPRHFKVQSLPAAQQSDSETLPSSILEFTLDPQDLLVREPFCLVITPQFNLLLLQGAEGFGFSFNPELVEQVWLKLKSHPILASSQQFASLEKLVEDFGFKEPDYQLVSSFTRQLIQNIPSPLPKISDKAHPKKETTTAASADLDLQLLQALTHEVRTPLTTIRTLTQLLLRRCKPTPEISKHLEVIEQECSAQINRMELIFRAAELKASSQNPDAMNLVPISLEQVLQESIPRWQQQAHRRQVSLEVSLPHKLPAIVTDPAVLEQMLTNLIEQFTRNLPAGGHIQVEVTTAGNQLKLRFTTDSAPQDNFFKSLGKLLVFQPETGNLALNHQVTKNIFRSLGARLTVRKKPGHGEVLTVFLPLRS